MERDRIGENERFLQGFERFRAQVLSLLHDVRSIHASAFGEGCADIGLAIEMKNWGDVDRAIKVTGAFLRANDLREEVTFCVWPGYEILVRRN